MYQEDSINGFFCLVFMEVFEVLCDEVMVFCVIVIFDDGVIVSDDVLIGVKEVSIVNNGIFIGVDMYVIMDLCLFN